MRIIDHALVMYRLEHYGHVRMKVAYPTCAEYCMCKSSFASHMNAENNQTLQEVRPDECPARQGATKSWKS